MNPWWQLLLVWLLAALMMTLGWQWQRRRSNAGIVDVLWAAGVGGSAALLAITGNGAVWTRAALALLGGAWGLRLSLHLWRRVRGEAEDGRYRSLRAHWQGAQWKFFAFFQFQAFLIVLFALPFAAVARNPQASTPWLVAAVALWLLSVLGESIADAQLARFRNDPSNRGRTCRDGLWRYSRHPNYFFEWLHWFAYVVLATGSPLFAWSWIGPVVMLVSLNWLTGIPFVEAQSLRSRGDDYRDYQRTTSRFIPWMPKP